MNGTLLINPYNSLFFLSPTVPGEVERIINDLDIKKSNGPNSIPVFILKSLKLFFSFWLSQLINLSFKVGIFPDILKSAKVFIKKNANLTFRITDQFIFYLCLLRFLKKLFPLGFILTLVFAEIILPTIHISGLIDSGSYVCGVFVDLEKAFDTVNHNILCDKLNLILPIENNMFQLMVLNPI